MGKLKFGRRRFLAALAAAGAGAAGWGLYRRAQRPAPLVLRTPPGDLSPLVRAEPYDVCVIGSGPAGTVLTQQLAQQGLQVLWLESGVELARLSGEPRYAELEIYESHGAIDYPARGSRVRALGGTSNVWTGRSSRLHEIDFETNAYTPENAPWPIRYAELQPYYARAEETLRVRGEDLSSFQPPRKAPPPLPAQRNIDHLKELLAGIGVTIDHSLSSTAPQGGGPLRMARDIAPRLIRRENVHLVSGATVTALACNAQGRIVGAQVSNLDRKQATARARLFVVAGGGIESSRLLHLSRCERFPTGIGNRHDLLGRRFMEHPNLNFTANIDLQWATLSRLYELGRSHQFYEAFKKRGLGSILPVFIHSWVYRDDLKDWELSKLPDKAGTALNRLRQSELRIGATLEMLPQRENRIMLAERENRFGNPGAAVKLSYADADRATMTATRELIRSLYARLGARQVRERGLTWSHHHLGGCPMGEHSRTSVVDRDLKVHGTANLYVASSAVFVTGGAAHPTLAITALSHRLADHLATRFSTATRRGGRRGQPADGDRSTNTAA